MIAGDVKLGFIGYPRLRGDQERAPARARVQHGERSALTRSPTVAETWIRASTCGATRCVRRRAHAARDRHA